MELQTSRLSIRPLCMEDWKNIQQIFADFSSSELSIYDAPLPVDEDGVQKLVTQFAESGYFFAVLLKNSGEMPGYVCFHPDGDTLDMGYLFHRNYHGKGYALEACNTLLDYFEEQGVSSFSAHTAMENGASTRLLSKLGFELRSIRTFSFHKDEQGQPISFHSGKFLLKL